MSAPTLSAPAALVGSFTPDVFAAHLASLPPSLPGWWVARKRAAYARFASLPMPTRTDEMWRFSSIGTLTLDGFTLDAAASVPLLPIGIPKAAQLVFANGRLVSRELLSSDLVARGVIVDTLQNALVHHDALVREHLLAQPPKLGSPKFAALHEAFLADGAFIYVPRDVQVALPIGVFSHAIGATSAVFPHTLVVLAENARATVIEYFGSDADTSAQFAAGANDLYAGHGAQLTYIGKQDWSHRALSIQSNSTVVRRDARVQSLNLHLGARQARHESLSRLAAPGAFSEMLALTVAEAGQEFDQRTLQIHEAPNTKSDLLYKNALRGTAKTHGATSSRIDPEQEFYLQSRGIAKEQADELLTFGFFEEVLARLIDHDLHEALRLLIQTKFKK